MLGELPVVVPPSTLSRARAEKGRLPGTDGSAPSGNRARWDPRVAVGSLAVLVLVQAGWIIGRFGLRWTNEDQTLLWYAAREFARGRWHQPHFFGQRYGSVLEAIPSAALYRVGVALPAAQVLTSAVLGSAPAFVLAAAAYRRRRFGLCAFALALPVLLTSELRIVALAPRGFGLAPLAASAAVALAALPANAHVTPRRLCAVALFGAVAAPLDQTTLIAVAPAVVVAWAKASSIPIARRSIVVAAGALPAVAWETYGRTFYRTRADYDLYSRGTSFRFSWSYLRIGYGRLDAQLRYLAPDLLRNGALVAAAIVGLVLVALGVAAGAPRRGHRVSGRRPERIALGVAALGVLGAAVAILGTKRADANYALYLNTSRLFLSLPIAAWLLVAEIARLGTRGPVTRSRRGILSRLAARDLALITLVGLAVLTLAIRLPGAPARAERQLSGTVIVEPRRTDDVRRTCARLAQRADRLGDPLVVFWQAPALDYGCAALEDLPTMYGQLERRAWRTRAEESASRTELMMWGWVFGCDPAPAGVRCRTVDGENDLVEVRFPSQPALEIVRAMGGRINSSQPGR